MESFVFGNKDKQSVDVCAFANDVGRNKMYQSLIAADLSRIDW